MSFLIPFIIYVGVIFLVSWFVKNSYYKFFKNEVKREDSPWTNSLSQAFCSITILWLIAGIASLLLPNFWVNLKETISINPVLFNIIILGITLMFNKK